MTLVALLLGTNPVHAFAPSDDVYIGVEPNRILRTHVERQHALRMSAEWQSFIQAEGAGWQAVFDEKAGHIHRAWGPGIALGTLDSDAHVEAALRGFFGDNPGLLQVDDDELVLRDIGYVAHTDTWHVHFDRLVNDVPVWRGGVNVVIKQGNLIWFQGATHPDAGFTADIPQLELDVAVDAAVAQSPTAHLEHTFEGAELVLLPTDSGSSTTYQLVWLVSTQTEEGPGDWRWMVNAHSGQYVTGWNEVRFLSGTVHAEHHARNPGSELVESPVPWARVSNGDDNVYTDFWDGSFELDGDTFSTSLRRGAFLTISNQDGDNASAEWTGPDYTWTTASADITELDSYVFLHHVQAWGAQFAPGIQAVENSLTSYVNINDTCNAYYNGDVNFFVAGGGCNNTGQIADVNYHEWGHGFHGTSLISGSWDGSMGEGIADVVAFHLTGDNVVAPYFRTDGSGIRDVSPNRVYPDDVVNEVHYDGLIFAGAVWDLWPMLTDKFGDEEGWELSSTLLANSIKLGPTLTEAYDGYVIADDDDGDLGNGTPNLCEIIDAFDQHGLGPGGTAGLVQAGHTPLENQPSTATEYPVLAQVVNLAAECAEMDVLAASIVYSTDGGESWDQEPLDVSQDTVEGVLSGLPGATVVHYYVEVETSENDVTVPSGGVINPFSFVVGELTQVYFQDFEGDDGEYGHELLAGQASQGADDWQYGTPVGLGGDPDFCYSGDSCWGNDLGGSRDGADWNGEYQNEKHNRLSSPAIEIGDDEGQLVLQFRRWLTVEDGYYDSARVLVDGQQVWTNHESRQSVGDEHHIDEQWALTTVEIQDVDGDGVVTVSWEIESDQGLSMGGWNVDDVAIYRLTEGEGPDGGPDDTGDVNGTVELAPTGCGGCASGSVPAGGLLAGLVGMLGLVAVRRRR